MSSTVVDVWMQHPTVRFLQQEAFASLRRWSGTAIPEQGPPLGLSLQSMDAAGVGFGLLSAWSGPREGFLISNDEVATWVAEHPDRFAGLAAVDLDKPMAAVRELHRCVTELGFKGLRVVPWLWQAPPTDRATTRSTRPASSSGFRFARRSDTPARCARARRGGRSHISTRWRSIFRS